MLNFVIDCIDNDADRKLIESLYIEYMPFLKKRAYLQTKDINVANDLAHDCMVNIIKHLDSIKKLPENKIRAYFSVSINNIVKNYLKRASKQAICNTYNLSDDYYLSADVNIEDELDQKYDYLSIRTAFDKLRERDKTLIVMKYDLELSDNLIADVLNIKQDSVRMSVLRSVGKLKKQIKEQEG